MTQRRQTAAAWRVGSKLTGRLTGGWQVEWWRSRGRRGGRRTARRWWRTNRAWLIVFVLAVSAGATGLAGAGRLHPLRGERFDAVQVTVRPTGAEGVRVREVWDVDFGRHQRRGLRLEIPTDLGVPSAVRVTSPSANTDVRVDAGRDVHDIRVGSVAETFSGQHRYVVEYTLPDALAGTDSLALDVLASTNPLDTARVEVVVTGLRFDATFCDVGREYTHGGCELTWDGGAYRTVLTDVPAGEGVTISGDGATPADALDVPLPDVPPRPDRFPRLMGAVLGAAAIAPLLVLRLFARWYGINTVRKGGPTEAAFADADAAAAPTPSGETYRVPDAELEDLVTTEFAPPAGLRAWQGVLAVNETIDSESVIAWFSDLIAAGALTVVTSGPGSVRLARGPQLTAESAREQRIVERLFGDRDEVTLSGVADARVADTWSSVMRLQAEYAAGSGWWRRHAPGVDEPRPTIRINPYWLSIVAAHALLAGLLLLQTRLFTLIGALLRLPVVLLSPPAVALAATVVAAGWAYLAPSRRAWPARSAAGSAVALRTLSFVRFLNHSEGRHVEAAWEQGRLREYSAWAVALGASDAWARAVAASGVTPAVDVTGAAPDLSGLGRAFAELDVDRRPRREPYDNPWPRYFKALASGSGRRSGGGSSYRRGSRGSRGVGRGGGGGRRSTW